MTTTKMVRHSFNRNRALTLIYSLSFLIGLAGLYLMFRSVMKAVNGSYEAVALLLSFFLAVACFVWLIKSGWQIILDQSDILDVFRKTSKEKKSKIEPVLNRTERDELFFKEHGYRFRLNEYASGTDISLIQIEMETPDHYLSQTGSYYLVFRIAALFDHNLIFVNPRLNDFSTPDVKLYAHELPERKVEHFHSSAGTVTLMPEEWLKEIFTNHFIVNDLNVLFSIYRLKYISLARNSLTAVKDGVVESCAYDIEAYHLLHRLIQLIKDHYKRFQHQNP